MASLFDGGVGSLDPRDSREVPQGLRGRWRFPHQCVNRPPYAKSEVCFYPQEAGSLSTVDAGAGS